MTVAADNDSLVTQLTSVTTEMSDGGFVITISAACNQLGKIGHFATHQPTRLAVDVFDAESRLDNNKVTVNNDYLETIHFVQTTDRTRIVLRLNDDREYNITNLRHSLQITLFPLPDTPTPTLSNTNTRPRYTLIEDEFKADGDSPGLGNIPITSEDCRRMPASQVTSTEKESKLSSSVEPARTEELAQSAKSEEKSPEKPRLPNELAVSTQPILAPGPKETDVKDAQSTKTQSSETTQTVISPPQSDEKTSPPIHQLHSFIEARVAPRLSSDPQQRDTTLTEARAHLEFEGGEKVIMSLETDIVLDGIESESIDLKTGAGLVDLRRASVLFNPTDSMSFNLGRQIMNWGTGDQVFINDPFPKDYLSFAAGRDPSYLDAPVDAVHAAFLNNLVNIDLVAMPIGATDRFIDGSRISLTDFNNGQVRGRQSPLRVTRQDDFEGAVRLHRDYLGLELATYGFWGHWNSPAGVEETSGVSIFPSLNRYGASARGRLLKGTGNFELAYFDSTEDSRGDNPFIANSEWRVLIGYEQDIFQDTTLGLQYTSTIMSDHADYLTTLPSGAIALGRRRDVATLRLTRLLNNKTIRASSFLFHSPTDGDGHTMLSIDYQANDQWTVGAAVNWFYGDRTTLFGQYKDASNGVLFLRSDL